MTVNEVSINWREVVIIVKGRAVFKFSEGPFQAHLIFRGHDPHHCVGEGVSVVSMLIS